MRTPAKVTERNAHIWLPCELIAREDALRRAELDSKYASQSRQAEIRLVRVLLMAQTVQLPTPSPHEAPPPRA